jgi:hypothetical protein
MSRVCIQLVSHSLVLITRTEFRILPVEMIYNTVSLFGITPFVVLVLSAAVNMILLTTPASYWMLRV